MSCPHFLDGIHPFCRATRETLVAGLHDLSLCRSCFWSECPSLRYAEAAGETREKLATEGGDPALDREAPGARPPTTTVHRRDPRREVPLDLARLMRSRLTT